MLKAIVKATFVAVVFAGLIACSSEQPQAPSQSPLVLKDYGPQDVRAGQDFNVQPSGVSAIWASTENATPATVIVIKGVRLKSDVQQDGKLITAAVPPSVYESAGEYPIYLLDEKSGQRSNELKFIVK